MTSETLPAPATPGETNPYVGPRTFTRAEAGRFFGREREASELLSLVISQRLVLFYAQSGAGKSSLINTRLVPRLEREGFAVLPVARVGGELLSDAAPVENVFLFNLMQSIDRHAATAQLAHLGLSDFLNRLTSEDGREWRYLHQPDAAVPASPPEAESEWVTPNTVVIIDQFEEILTTHLDRWQERSEFFSALNAAMEADPHLWVVLTLREDYVAALDPYAGLMTDKLRARYYMERMELDAAVDAVRKPAEQANRPFAPDVAEKLVDDLRQVRVPGQEKMTTGKYVEPVQLQVVCYQLWERINSAARAENRTEPITEQDLEAAAAGDVNEALCQFYEETLALVRAEPDVAAVGVNERTLREWFDRELITDTGIRSTVFRNDATGRTGSLANAAVDALSRRFLVRTELRGGGAWVELVHDRFVDPVRASNAEWWTQHLSPCSNRRRCGKTQGRPDGLLLRGQALEQAAAWAAKHASDLEQHERAFLEECIAARAAAEHAAQQSRRIRVLAGVLGVVALFAIVLSALAFLAWQSSMAQTREAARARATADAAAQRASAAEATALADATRALNAEGTALAARGTAVAEATRAAHLAHRGRAADRVKAAQRELTAKEDASGSRALILASLAVRATWDEEGYVTDDAVSTLQDAIDAAPPWRMTLTEGIPIKDAAFSPDGTRIVTADDKGVICIWETSTGRLMRSVKGRSGSVNSVAFNPHEGNIIASAGADGSIRLWDSSTGQELRTLPIMTEPVRRVTFSPDGRKLLSVGDHSVRVWDMGTGELSFVLPSHGSTSCRPPIRPTAG